MASPEFQTELDGIGELLNKVDQRLAALSDQAIYEELPRAVPDRIANRRRALELFRTQIVDELPELAGSA